jgi:hypothetical protein
MIIPLGRLSPAASRDLPGLLARKTPAAIARGAQPLFGLAPGGVYPATCVTAGAVRSYRTISPLPIGNGGEFVAPATAPPLKRSLRSHVPIRRSQAVYFLWHFPWNRFRRALPAAVFPWSPDFPPAFAAHALLRGKPSHCEGEPAASKPAGRRRAIIRPSGRGEPSAS